MIKTIIFALFISTLISCSDNNAITDPLRQLHIDADKGNAEAQFKLGFKYYFGDQVPVNKDSSKYWLNKSAENGHVIAKKTYDAFFKIIPTINNTDSIK